MRKKGIQNKDEEMAHYVGIRISRINARNTSALAYDGSGKVERVHKKDLATFTTGKVYHADLSASYNIAARYFIRAYQKSRRKRHGCPCRQKSLCWQKEHLKPYLHSLVLLKH
jgi:putative transposase